MDTIRIQNLIWSTCSGMMVAKHLIFGKVYLNTRCAQVNSKAVFSARNIWKIKKASFGYLIGPNMTVKPTYEELERRVQELEKIESEYKSSKEALRNSEAQYRLLFEQANLGIFIAQDGYLKAPNPYLRHILDYSLSELEDQPFSQFIHPEHLPLVNKRHQERLSGKTGLPQTYDFRVISKNGTIIWVQLSTVLIQFKGRPATLNFLHDITERKHMEQALKDSENMFRTIFNLSQQAIGLTEINTGKLIKVNAKLCELTQYSEKELVGKTTTELDFYTEKDRKKFIDELKHSGFVDGLEMEFRAKDGSKLTALMFANIIKISDLNYILTIFFDLTRLKILEEELIARNKDLLLAQRIAGIGNWSLDPEIGVPVWSEEVYRIYKRDMELGPYLLEDYPTIYRDKWWGTFSDAIQGAMYEGRPYDIELKLALPSGNEKWIHAVCQPHSERGPMGYYLQGTIQDITERKHAEDALKDSEQKFRILFESSKDANYISTIEGHIVEANQSFIELFNYNQEELPTLRTQDLYVNPEDRSIFLNEIKRKGFAKDFEEKLQDKNGNVIDCQVTATLRKSADGTIEGYQGIIRDVTDIKRKQIEKEKLIIELQKALAEIKTLSGLLPICSHCKKIRDDKGYWTQIESYIHQHSEAVFSHGICQECAKKYYPDLDLYDD